MEGDLNSEADAGIVPRSVKTVVETLESSGAEFTIRVSFLELYNEELQDLLVPPTSDKKLKLCETDKGVVCTNLEEITVLSKNDIFEIVARGIKQRATAATLCNKNSSRSHSIFTMKIMIRETAVDGEEVVRHGQLNLVDLAGSECVGRSGAKDGRAKEAGSINQSLLTLGRVITALVDHHGHIPYRDSKLTRLLQESLGGRAKTCIIATLSPAQMAVEESLSTLDYAHRAKNIKNAPQVNQKMTKKTVMKEYCAEIETLRAQLQITREKNGVYVDPAEYYAMEQRISAQEAQLVDCESSLRQRSEELKVLRQEKDEVQSHLVETQRTLGSVTSQLQAAQVELETAHARLKSVQIELACTERVVSEQVTTESALQKHGGELQSEVSLRRGERDRLLDKVGRLADQEALRHDTTTKFVAQVSVVCQEELLKGVSEMLASTSTESSQLCSGVLEMLSKGKDTCGSLKAAIDAALVTLIRDAERAKVDMTTSCGELNEHLRGTRDNLTTVLTSLQTSLGAWLGEVDDGMQRASSQLSQQQEQLAALEAHLKRSSENVQQLASDFQANQEARGQQALADARSFEAELSQRLQQHKEELGEQARAAQQGVASRAKEIEKVRHPSLISSAHSSRDFSLSFLKL
jgi:kinesin family protein 11